MIIRIAVVIIAIVGVLIGHGWCRRGGRWRVVTVTIAGVWLFPTDLPDASLLLSFFLLIRSLGLVFVFLIVSVVEIAATATSQYLAIVVIGRRYSIHRVRGGSDRVAGFAALKIILGFGVATQVVVVHGLQTGTDSVQVKVVAGVVESRRFAIHVIPVRAGLTLLIKGGIVGAKEPK